ncbi:hypothetical protein KM1_012820 [Entamoeba histolytica HM-3:IMSS]|uniref:Uncharacterized protein n=1 Tax=Entamoeba histolytica HM-3:IMSS TaxID=885315 RepID=M7WH17_ENTHI|nr:hypothetical protein KM1_012820 [Entamoeba histolytica HM-3:IMSS]
MHFVYFIEQIIVYLHFGDNDILVYKENYKTKSFCKQRSYEYKGISNALYGKELPNRFNRKRLIVVEMKWFNLD